MIAVMENEYTSAAEPLVQNGQDYSWISFQCKPFSFVGYILHG